MNGSDLPVLFGATAPAVSAGVDPVREDQADRQSTNDVEGLKKLTPRGTTRRCNDVRDLPARYGNEADGGP